MEGLELFVSIKTAAVTHVTCPLLYLCQFQQLPEGIIKHLLDFSCWDYTPGVLGDLKLQLGQLEVVFLQFGSESMILGMKTGQLDGL